ncbi:MAG: hypothetical protein ACRD8W_19250, partial [Nitrososphaeraceae archaeon]
DNHLSSMIIAQPIPSRKKRHDDNSSSACVYDVYAIMTLLTYKYRTGSILNWMIASHAAAGASNVKAQT